MHSARSVAPSWVAFSVYLERHHVFVTELHNRDCFAKSKASMHSARSVAPSWVAFSVYLRGIMLLSQSCTTEAVMQKLKPPCTPRVPSHCPGLPFRCTFSVWRYKIHTFLQFRDSGCSQPSSRRPH